MPVRIQRKRERGWRTPPNAKYVGRGTRWGNPFVVIGGSVAGPSWSEARALSMTAPVRANRDEDMALYGSHSSTLDAHCHALELFFSLCNVRKRDQPAEFSSWIEPLLGRDLSCWCSDQPCHADVLLGISSEEAS